MPDDPFAPTHAPLRLVRLPPPSPWPDGIEVIRPLAESFAHMARRAPGSEATLEALAMVFERIARRTKESSDLLRKIGAVYPAVEWHVQTVTTELDNENLESLYNALALRHALRTLGNPTYWGH